MAGTPTPTPPPAPAKTGGIAADGSGAFQTEPYSAEYPPEQRVPPPNLQINPRLATCAGDYVIEEEETPPVGEVIAALRAKREEFESSFERPGQVLPETRPVEEEPPAETPTPSPTPSPTPTPTPTPTSGS